MSASLLLAVALSGAPERYGTEISAAVAEARNVFPVPEALVLAIIRQESGFQPRAVSRAGAIGLMQVLGTNARSLGLRSESDLFEPRLNILAGVRLLASLLRHYQGDVIAALVAYNAGPRPPGAPIPENGETPGYVLAVLRLWALEERQAASLDGGGQ